MMEYTSGSQMGKRINTFVVSNEISSSTEAGCKVLQITYTVFTQVFVSHLCFFFLMNLMDLLRTETISHTGSESPTITNTNIVGHTENAQWILTNLPPRETESMIKLNWRVKSG